MRIITLPNLTVRLENETDMDECFAYIKDKMKRIPILKGTVTKHYCCHDEASHEPCVIDERFEI